MGRTNTYANVAEDKNYLGELFLVGAYQTPFLNMIGGIDGARSKISRSFVFPIAQPWNLSSADQPNITEADSVSANDATVIGRSQETNTVQIYQETVEVSYMKQSSYGEIDGLASVDTTSGQPVNDEMSFQRMGHLRQIALDADYSFLNGTHQAAANSATAARSRGVITACSGNNTIDGSGAKFSKNLLNQLMKAMADAGAVFENMVLFCNSFNKQQVSDVYGYAPEDRNVGGVNIQQIYTDFAPLGVVYAPNVPAATVLVADMNYCYPVFCPVPGKGLVFYEDLAQNAASMRGQMYGQIGLDYGPKEYHGTIHTLATS